MVQIGEDLQKLQDTLSGIPEVNLFHVQPKIINLERHSVK